MSAVREIISTGTSANDGTGDNLRSSGIKINSNFGKLFYMLGGDSDQLSSQISIADNGILFEGTSADNFETLLRVINPTADRTINLPDGSGTVILDVATQTLTNKTLDTPQLITPRIWDTSQTHSYIFGVAELAANRNIALPLLSGNDTFVFQAHTQTLTNKTLTSPTITNPNISTAIKDVNGANIISLDAIASAVNYFKLGNNSTGNNPTMEVAGTDSTITLDLLSKNTGAVRINKLALQTVTTTTNGGTSQTVSHIDCNKGTQLNLSLANGIVSGEMKVYTNRGAGQVVVTPTSFAHGTSFTIPTTKSCTVIWDGLKWYICGGYSQVTIA